LVFSQLFEEFEKVEVCLLSNYSKQYASILFQLHFNRRNKKKLSFDENALNVLRTTEVYERLAQPIILFLEKELHGQANEEEIFFFQTVDKLLNLFIFCHT
ncbi:TPA: hypothetical protein I0I20_RS13710, partial [Enterococcus faecium]